MEDAPSPNRRREDRPWGYFEQFTLNEPSTVKLLHVRAGEEFSLQTHEHRDEFWRVVGGSGQVTVGNVRSDANIGDEFFTPRGTPHRAEGAEDEDLRILEISFGQFDENDITRLEDKYGRT